MKRTNKKFSTPTAWKQCGASMRRAALSLLTLVMAFTAQTAWADYGWYSGAMTIGGATTDCTAWSTDPDNPTDIGVVTDMTITSIAFNVWSDANDRGGANMFFRIWDGGNSQVGTDQDIYLGPATRIEGKAHDFSISWTGSEDLASAVGLTLEHGKTYYIDMWAKTYGSSGDEWYRNGGANYHAKLIYAPSGNCGTTGHESDVTWSLNSGGVLTISGSGAMANYGNSEEVPWYPIKDYITSVVIGEGVTSIGDFAFYECEYLASVSIPASVTSIGQDAFYTCGISATALTVTFATGSSLTTIGNSAFNNAKLSSISIPASVTSIGQEAFYTCEYLTTIDIPASVTSIGAGAFHGCGYGADAALTVTFASGSSLTTIGAEAFSETKLSSISIPASVTSIDWYAFNSCTLTTVSIPASVTSIGEGAFNGCEDLTTVTLNSNPFIEDSAFPDNATVKMYLTAHEGETNEYWMTFYNQNYSFKADDNTQVFKVELSGDEVKLHEIENKIVEATAAVVLKSTGNPVMTKKTNVSSNNNEPNSLSGVAVPAGEKSLGNMYVLSDGTKGVGFYKLKYGKTLGVGKAYLIYGEEETDPQQGGQNAREFLGFGDTTSINDVRGQKEDVRDEYYDLQGRRVSQPTKGLYIVNGKKVVIK